MVAQAHDGLGCVFSQSICGLLPESQLAVCQPHSLKREVGTIAQWPHARAC